MIENKLSTTIKDATYKFVEEELDYYKQWIFDKPYLIKNDEYKQLSLLQQIMYKMINEFVKNYDKWSHLLPINKDIEIFLSYFKDKEYEIGTYRTDFVYDENHIPRIIEITCRFAMNGYFSSSIFNYITNQYIDKEKSIKNINLYNNYFEYFSKFLKDKKSICILVGNDRRNESKHMQKIFNKTDIDLKLIEYTDFEENIENMKNSLIICELSHNELLSLKEDDIKFLAKETFLNDPRTIFFIHDKGFFSVLGNKELQKVALSEDEIKNFQKFYIPTYLFNNSTKQIWEKAKHNKSNWIIKNRTLGKSQEIYAGCVTEEKEWLELFNNDLSNMVLQEWIPQNKIKATIQNSEFEDYIAGTLLFFDNKFFGLAEFRTSSFPISNKVDHRKICSVISDNNYSNNKLFCRLINTI